MVVEESVEREVPPQPDQQRDPRERAGEDPGRGLARAARGEAAQRQQHDDHPDVAVRIVGERHGAPVGGAAEAHPVREHDARQLVEPHAPRRRVLERRPAVRRCAAHGLARVVPERQVVDAGDAECEHRCAHEPGRAHAEACQLGRPPGGHGQHDDRVEHDRAPGVEADLHVPAQELEAAPERQPAQLAERALPEPARGEPKHERQVGRIHELAAVAVGAHGDQVRLEHERDRPQQRPLGPGAPLDRQQVREEPGEEVVEQEPGELGQRQRLLQQRHRPVGRVDERVVCARAERRHAEEHVRIPQRVHVILPQRLLAHAHEAGWRGGVRGHERAPLERDLVEEHQRDQRQQQRHPRRAEREAARRPRGLGPAAHALASGLTRRRGAARSRPPCARRARPSRGRGPARGGASGRGRRRGPRPGRAPALRSK